MIALQRAAGNASTVALLRHTGKLTEEPPITLTIPGVVDGAAVDTWSFGPGDHPTFVGLMRTTDADSARLRRALTDGTTGSATLVMRKLTPLGWVRVHKLTMEGCTVDSYQASGEYEQVGLSFTAMELEP
jgi:hypothetical protein